MKRTILRTGLLAPMVLSTAYPDTVTTTGNLSINGLVTQMAGGMITLQATFSSGKPLLPIPMTAVQSIGFNATTFNPGLPPKLPGGGAADWANASIVLRGGQRDGCNLQRIDADTIHCGGKGRDKGADYPRSRVLRILAAGQ